MSEFQDWVDEAMSAAAKIKCPVRRSQMMAHIAQVAGAVGSSLAYLEAIEAEKIAAAKPIKVAM